jgi:predicted RNase H-like HicB family nuclease
MWRHQAALVFGKLPRVTSGVNLPAGIGSHYVSALGHHGFLYAKIYAMCYHRRGLCSVSIEETAMVKHVKVIVEKHSDGYVAYPLGLKGVIVGEGDTYEEALADVQSAITFHIETFGSDVVEDAASVLEVFVAEAGLPL